MGPVLVLLLVPGAVRMATSDWLGADAHVAWALAVVVATGPALVLVEFGVRAVEPRPLWVQWVTLTGPAVCTALLVLWSWWRVDPPTSPTPVGHCARCAGVRFLLRDLLSS